MSFKGVQTKRVSTNVDEVTLTFKCRGSVENNYEGFLEDACEAVIQLRANYEDGGKPGEHADFIRQKIINALENIFPR